MYVGSSREKSLRDHILSLIMLYILRFRSLRLTGPTTSVESALLLGIHLSNHKEISPPLPRSHLLLFMHFSHLYIMFFQTGVEDFK